MGEDPAGMELKEGEVSTPALPGADENILFLTSARLSSQHVGATQVSGVARSLEKPSVWLPPVLGSAHVLPEELTLKAIPVKELIECEHGAPADVGLEPCVHIDGDQLAFEPRLSSEVLGASFPQKGAGMKQLLFHPVDPKHAFDLLDRNNDGKITRSDFAAGVQYVRAAVSSDRLPSQSLATHEVGEVHLSDNIPQALAQKQNIVDEQTFDTQVKTGIVDKVTEVSKENVFPVTVAVHRDCHARLSE